MSHPSRTFEFEYLDYGTSSGDDSFTSRANVRWNDKITWIFLQIMLGISEPLDDATDDTLLRENIWDQALLCFREQLVINYNEASAEEITGFLDSRFDVKNMQDQWDRMIEIYRNLKAKNELIGINGVHSSVTWPFYDEVGQILVSDCNVCIHPEIVLSTSIRGEGPTMVTINRNEPHIRGSMSTEEREKTIEENARRRGVVHMSTQQIQEKILVPARRTARIHNADTQGTTSSGSLSNVTGRRTRRRAERAEEQDSLNSGDYSEGNDASNDIRSLIDDMVTRSNQHMKENIAYFHKLALERDEARFNNIKKILDEQRRLDQEERENYFKYRNNSSC